MDHLDGMLSKDTLKLMREKWDLADEADEARANFTSILLDNQARHIQRLTEETRAVSIGTWVSDIFDSLKSKLMTHPLFDLCAMQPMSQPVGIVYYYRPRAGTTEMTDTRTGEKITVPSIQLDIAPVTITAQPRMVKAFRGQHETTDAAVEELLSEVSREIIGEMLNSQVVDDHPGYIDGVDDLKEKLSRAGHIIHRQSQRAPANRIVANAEMLTKLGIECPEDDDTQLIQALGDLDEKWKVFLDPLFPKGKILTWYQGESPMDTGIAYSPYIMVQITPNFVSPEDGTLRRAIRIRHKITHLRPEFSYLIKTEKS